MSNASFVLKKFLDDNIIKIMKGKNMVFLLQFFTMILISMVIEIIVVNNLPKWQKKEHDERQLARQRHEVYLPKTLANNVIFPASLLSAIGILLILFPQICESIGFDYRITLLIVWVLVILNFIVCARFFVKIKYDDEKIEYTNAFGYKKTFRYEDIHNIIEKNGFIRIIIENKTIRFGKGLYGADRFIAYLKERLVNS